MSRADEGRAPDAVPDVSSDAVPHVVPNATPPSGAPGPLGVRVQGMVRGAELPAAGALALDGATLVLVPVPPAWLDAVLHDRTLPPEASAAPLRLTLAALDGVVWRDGTLTLHLPGGDAVELVPANASGDGRVDASAFAALAGRAVAMAYALPEVTRALRAFGSRRGLPGSDHDRFFAPLVEPLRRARDVVAAGHAAPWTAADAVPAERVDAALRAALAALAADRAPESAPDRRALEAELLEVAEPLLDAVARLGEAAVHLAAAGDDARLLRWRAWSAALGDAFVAADRCWIAALPVLADARGGHGRLWRRVLRRGGAA